MQQGAKLFLFGSIEQGFNRFRAGRLGVQTLNAVALKCANGISDSLHTTTELSGNLLRTLMLGAHSSI